MEGVFFVTVGARLKFYTSDQKNHIVKKIEAGGLTFHPISWHVIDFFNDSVILGWNNYNNSKFFSF